MHSIVVSNLLLWLKYDDICNCYGKYQYLLAMLEGTVLMQYKGLISSYYIQVVSKKKLYAITFKQRVIFIFVEV